MSTAIPITADPPRRRGGPKTEAGKRRASMNAVKHGMYSAAVVLPGESHQEYDALLARYLDHFRPTSPDQEHLVHTLASADWRIKRLVHIQTTKLAERIERQPDEGRDPVTQAYSFEVRHSEALLTADKHEARLQRDYDRALRRLLEIEKRRAQTKNQRNELESTQPAGRGLHRSGNSRDLAASRESVVRELLESAAFDAPPEPPAVSPEVSETTNASASAGAQPAPDAPQAAPQIATHVSHSERRNCGNEQQRDAAELTLPVFPEHSSGDRVAGDL
jgi:hypothetical protein